MEAFSSIRSISLNFDIIIDDGSHMSSDIVNSFLTYFQLLKPGGIYIIENTRCLDDLNYGGGVINDRGGYQFFKKMIDIISLNLWNNKISIQEFLGTFFLNRRYQISCRKGG